MAGADWQRFVEPWWKSKAEAIEQSVGDEVQSDFLDRFDFSSLGLVSPPEAATPDLLTQVERHFGEVPHPRWADPGHPTLVVQAAHVLDAVLGREGGSGDECRSGGPVDLGTIGTMVRWGGGFGLQVWIQRQMGCRATEFVIDLPVMSRLQEAFLSRNLPADQVQIYDGEFREGAINLVPLARVDDVPDAEVFCALHTLDESTVEAQEYVVGRRFFGASTRLLAWTPRHPDFAGSDNWMTLMREL